MSHIKPFTTYPKIYTDIFTAALASGYHEINSLSKQEASSLRFALYRFLKSAKKAEHPQAHDWATFTISVVQDSAATTTYPRYLLTIGNRLSKTVETALRDSLALTSAIPVLDSTPDELPDDFILDLEPEIENSATAKAIEEYGENVLGRDKC